MQDTCLVDWVAKSCGPECGVYIFPINSLISPHDMRMQQLLSPQLLPSQILRNWLVHNNRKSAGTFVGISFLPHLS